MLQKSITLEIIIEKKTCNVTKTRILSILLSHSTTLKKINYEH